MSQKGQGVVRTHRKFVMGQRGFVREHRKFQFFAHHFSQRAPALSQDAPEFFLGAKESIFLQSNLCPSTQHILLYYCVRDILFAKICVICVISVLICESALFRSTTTTCRILSSCARFVFGDFLFYVASITVATGRSVFLANILYYCINRVTNSTYYNYQNDYILKH
jgi:hypothetical protein